MTANLGLMTNQHKTHKNQQISPAPSKGKTPAEYNNWKVVAKDGGSTMILQSGLSKVNAHALYNKLNSFINNKHKDVVGAGKTSVKFIIIH